MAYIEKLTPIKSQRLAEQRLRRNFTTLAVNERRWSRLTKEQILHQWDKIEFTKKKLYQLCIHPALEEGNIYWLEFISKNLSKSDLHLRRVDQ